jgi:predicted Fe-Mo cluster-binding NifX family protein
MRVCFPVQHDEGFESKVYNHFGSAPLFVIVDTEKNVAGMIKNRDQHHVHGACNPIQALDNQNIDAVVVGGIGAGALGKLNQSGIKVYRAQSQTIKENIALFASQALTEFTLQGCCGGQSHGDTCAH